jgi:hypothetical protein
MDTEMPVVIEANAADEGFYARRMQALLAARSELAQAGPVRLAGIAGPTQNRAASAPRTASRQLSLPLARERTRRRARMVR